MRAYFLSFYAYYLQGGSRGNTGTWKSAEDSAHPKNLRDAPVDAEAESQRADCPPEC